MRFPISGGSIDPATAAGRIAHRGGLRLLTAKLNRAAARALNATFGVTAFKAGIPLGKVRVQAEASETELLARGATAPAIDPAVLQALARQGIAPGIIGPATLTGRRRASRSPAAKPPSTSARRR